ncbi:MAG TPA: hypothetical protein VHD88_01540, partial [Pyrinomonadaceae bacterium]|nr:hypothetical protein [Pyrinomonadaceae bacterium]
CFSSSSKGFLIGCWPYAITIFHINIDNLAAGEHRFDEVVALWLPGRCRTASGSERLQKQ